MPNKYPFAVRLIGFPEVEADKLGHAFVAQQGNGHGYFRLLEDNLQDPDIYLANADDIKALAKLSYLGPTEIQPALLIGKPAFSLPYPCVPRPLDWRRLFAELDDLIEKRADVLARLDAAAVVAVSERRRRERLDIDLTDPTEYERMRRIPVRGGVLVIDKTAMLRDYLQGILARHELMVGLAKEEEAAADYCNRQKVSIVLINTSTPGIDPYRLCQTIKRNMSVQKTSVIMLTGKPFVYEAVKARCAGCDGFLQKPLATHHLLSALKKFLPPLHSPAQ